MRAFARDELKFLTRERFYYDFSKPSILTEGSIAHNRTVGVFTNNLFQQSLMFVCICACVSVCVYVNNSNADPFGAY